MFKIIGVLFVGLNASQSPANIYMLSLNPIFETKAECVEEAKRLHNKVPSNKNTRLVLACAANDEMKMIKVQ